MATTPYPLPRETRESAILVGNGTVGPYGPSTFKIFDTVDVVVLTKLSGQEFFAEAAGTVIAKTSGQPFDTFSVTFPAPVLASTQIVFQSRRVHERQNAVTKGGAIGAAELEKELSKQGSVIEELRRDLDRAVRVDPGETPTRVKPGAAGELMKTDAGGNISGSGENVETIQGSTGAAAASAAAAGASAGNAAASAAAAATSQGNATTSATNAAASATTSANNALAAANSVAALPFVFSTATADADPGNGVFRLNNADPALATMAYVDNVDAAGVPSSGQIDSWDDSTNTVRGTLTIRSKVDATIRRVYNVTGPIVAGAGYRKIAMTYVDGSGVLAAGVEHWLTFDRAGDVGEVTLNGVQTLTNKTLTSPTINTPTISTPTITGGSWTGGTDLAIADGGTGASTAATAFSNLKQAASDTATGVVELATTAETQTGTDTTRAVTPAGFAGASLGIGQTWQDVLASRAVNTSYQNTTGKPIEVLIRGNATTATHEVSQNNSTWIVVGITVSSSRQIQSFIVPNGWYYRHNGAATLENWAELR